MYYFISSTELTNPTIDINTTSLQGVTKRIIWQQRCRVYVNCRVCHFCRAYEVHRQHLVSVLFIVMYSSLSLFHLKNFFYSHNYYNYSKSCFNFTVPSHQAMYLKICSLNMLSRWLNIGNLYTLLKAEKDF